MGSRLIGEMSDSKAGAGKDKMSLEHLVVPESKEVHTHTHTHKKNSGNMSKGHN